MSIEIQTETPYTSLPKKSTAVLCRSPTSNQLVFTGLEKLWLSVSQDASVGSINFALSGELFSISAFYSQGGDPLISFEHAKDQLTSEEYHDLFHGRTGHFLSEIIKVWFRVNEHFEPYVLYSDTARAKRRQLIERPPPRTEGPGDLARQFLMRMPEDLCVYFNRPCWLAHLTLLAFNDPAFTWSLMHLVSDGKTFIPSLVTRPGVIVEVQGHSVNLESELEQNRHFRVGKALTTLSDDDDFLPCPLRCVDEADPYRACLSRGVAFRDQCILSNAIKNKDPRTTADFSLGLPLLSLEPFPEGVREVCSWDLDQSKGSVGFEMAVRETIGPHTVLPLTSVTRSIIESNMVPISLKEPSRSNIHFLHWSGRSGLVSVLIMFFVMAACIMAYPVRVSGKVVSGLSDYREIFSLSEPPVGPYLVCFADQSCVRRLRVGNQTMCGDPTCTSDQIWPWRCPSVDRDIPCPDENCTGCDLCRGTVQFGECRSYGGKVVRAAASLAPPYPSRGLILSEHDAYFEGFERFSNVSVEGDNSPNETLVPQGQVGKLDHSTISMILLAVGLLLALVCIAINITRLYYHTKLPTIRVDSPDEDKGTEMGEMTNVEKTLLQIDKQPKARLFLDVHPSVTIPSLTIESILFLLSIASLIVIGVNADYEMSTLEERPLRVVYSNYTMPSGCSCSEPDTVESQLRCVFPCEYETTVGDQVMGIHFGLWQTCVDKYLVVLNRMQEIRCHYCDSGSASASCRSMRNGCPAATCHYTDSRHQAWKNGCFLEGGSIHRLDFSYSIYPAKFCRVSENPAPGITGYPTTAYTAITHSTLIAQSSYIRAKIGGIWQDYKEINGGVGSERAWLVDPNSIANGALKETSPAYASILRFAVLEDNPDAGGDNITVGLPQFSPQVFTQTCEVDITFKEMKCFTMDQACNGTYRIIEGHTYFMPYKSGMCKGIYMAAGEYSSFPEGINKCGDCTAEEVCTIRPTEHQDDNCTFTIMIEEQGNVTFNNTSGFAWVEVEQSLMGIVTLALGLAVIIIITVVIVTLVRRASRKGYSRVN